MRNDQGFTLIEILIAAFIMAVLVGGTASMFSNIFGNVARLNSKLEIIGLIQEVQSTMASRQACTTALGSQQYDTSAEDPIPDLKSNFTGGMPATFTLGNGETMAAGVELNSYDLVVQDLRWFGADPMGTSPTGERFYRMTLIGGLTPKRHQGGFSAKNLGSAFVTVDGSGAMISCFDLNPNEPETLENLKEMILGDVGNCPPGQVATGVDGSGNITCSNLPPPPPPVVVAATPTPPSTPPTTPQPTTPPVAATCPAGQFLQGINADGTPICGTIPVATPPATPPVATPPTPASPTCNYFGVVYPDQATFCDAGEDRLLTCVSGSINIIGDCIDGGE